MKLENLIKGDKFQLNNQIFTVTDKTINYQIGVIDNKGNIHYLHRNLKVQKISDNHEE